jgi:hypothetical protein
VVRFARLRQPHVANAPEPFEKLLGHEAGEILDDDAAMLIESVVQTASHFMRQLQLRIAYLW